eukprot:TRINITY_DN7453_c0_g1_i11.p1 TRINITY_DN7453_c0_g1~~TRINITY_DN7453_c0_g1_i11.p1  ORF type:complete len:485 (-),score=112.97 TRINITY_DN7453_c0_g1_i11:23-1477(-)
MCIRDSINAEYMGMRAQMGPGPRLPTGMKSQNQRLPTGYQQGQNFGGIGQTTQINVEARPVTKGGIPGIKGLKATGPERQIYNKNYYMILLKKKIDEIQKETAKFQKQEEDINRDNNLYFQLEKKYEELTKEVRNLEGQLADYNLAFDKLRTKTRPEDIKNMYEYIKIQNDKHRMILDDIFIERKKQEDQLNMIERELGDINKQLEIRIGELDPESRNEYEGLLNENRELNQIMQQQRMELEELQMRLQQYENRLQADTHKLKAKQIREQTQLLERKKDDLEMQLNEANLPFPQARDRLQARIKEDKEQLGILDKRIKEIQRLCDNYEKQLKEMTQELESDQKGEEKDKQKYEILYQRDKEMTEFIDNYSSNRKNYVESISTTQQHIVKMLDNISKMLYVVGQLPSLEEYQNIKTDLDSKATAKDNAEITLLKLQAELEKRTADLKKLEQAEERIVAGIDAYTCLLYTSPSPRDRQKSRMPSSA